MLHVIASVALLRSAAAVAASSMAEVATEDPMLQMHDQLVLLQTGALVSKRSQEKRDMLMVAHHKTGMVLALQAAECVNASSAGLAAFKRPARFNEDGPPAGMAMIHFTRDLRDLAVSAYMYHRFASQEPMHTLPGTAAEIKKIVQRQAKLSQKDMDWYETNDTETFQHWLNRVPKHIGLRAQLAQLMPQLDQMKIVSAFCKTQPSQCIEVDLGQFTADSESFENAWRSVFKFVGVDIAEHNDLRQCLEKLDENNPNFKAANEGPRITNHVTSTKLTAEDRAEIVSKIERLDAAFYNNMLSAETD